MNREEKEIMQDLAHRLRVIEGCCEGLMASASELRERLDRIEKHIKFSFDTTKHLLMRHDHNMRILGEVVAGRKK